MLKGAVPEEVYRAVVGVVRAYLEAIQGARLGEPPTVRVTPKCAKCRERWPGWWLLSTSLAALVGCAMSPLALDDGWERLYKAVWETTGVDPTGGHVTVIVAAEEVARLKVEEGVVLAVE